MSIFYLIFTILAAYFSFRYDGIEEYNSHKQHRLWFMCGYLICLSGFSYGLGGDKFAYMQYYEEYPDSLSEAGEFIWLEFMAKGHMPLWTLVNIFAKTVFGSFYAVQIIESVAINVAVCFIVSKYTHRFFLFLLVYFFTLQYFIFNTEVMREGVAQAFALIGMYGWMNGKKWLYIITLVIAVLFHPSALTILIFPLMRFKVSLSTIIYGLITAFLIWFLSDLLLGKVMLSVAGGLGAMVQKVLFYSIKASNIFGFTRSVFTYLIFPLIIMYTAVQYEENDELKKQKEQMMAFALALGIIVCSFTGFIRLYNSVRIFYLIMMTDFIYSMFKQRKHLIIRLSTLAGTIFLIGLQYMTPYKTTNTRFYDYFFPYTCILNEDKSVFIREIAHQEAVFEQESDDNVRNIK